MANPLSEQTLQTIIPAKTYAAIVSSSGKLDTLLPGEDGILSPSALESRKQEFSAGRQAAHTALKKAGILPSPVLQGSHREPLWPEGITGSISHSGKIAVAVVSHKTEIVSLGIDLQSSQSELRYDISSRVCTESELLKLPAGGTERTNKVIQIFSAKEAVYKAIWPLIKKYVGFKEVCLTFKNTDNSFSVFAESKIFPENLEFTGISDIFGEYIFNAVIIRTK